MSANACESGRTAAQIFSFTSLASAGGREEARNTLFDPAFENLSFRKISQPLPGTLFTCTTLGSGWEASPCPPVRILFSTRSMTSPTLAELRRCPAASPSAKTADKLVATSVKLGLREAGRSPVLALPGAEVDSWVAFVELLERAEVGRAVSCPRVSGVRRSVRPAEMRSNSGVESRSTSRHFGVARSLWSS